MSLSWVTSSHPSEKPATATKRHVRRALVFYTPKAVPGVPFNVNPRSHDKFKLVAKVKLQS